MSHPLQIHLPDNMNKSSAAVSFTDVKYVNNTNDIVYPIIPRDPHFYFNEYAGLPSERYKNIVYYYYQCHVAKNTRYQYIVPEEGNTAIVFRCSSQRPGAFLVGTPTFTRDPEYGLSGGDYFLVYFRTGMGYSFCPIPAVEFTDRSFPLNEIFSGKLESIMKDISEGMAFATTFQERIHIFEHFFEMREPLLLEVPKQIISITNAIRSNVGSATEKRIISYCLYTDRHIQRMFRQYVGIPPKLYSNIIRHYKARMILCSRPHLNLTELAYELGYYDQSHFIKQFKRFLGFAPTQIINNLAHTE